MDNSDVVQKIHEKARLLAQELVLTIAKADKGTDISHTVLLSAIAVGMLLGSNAETMRQVSNNEGLRNWLTIVFGTATAMIKDENIKVRFEVIEKDV